MATIDDSGTTFEPVTAWHPMLVALLEEFLPAGWKLVPELLLRRLPQRVDIVIVRREGSFEGVPRKLHSIFDFLRPHTLIEHKGPTDDLSAEDAVVLLGYAAQYMVLCGVNAPGEMALMVIADSIPGAFVRRVRELGGKLVERKGGIWRGRLAGMSLHGVATRDACWHAATERLLYPFSRAYLKAPGALLAVLDSGEERVYLSLYEAVEQFRKRRGPMAMKDEKLAKESREELIKRWMALASPEERLAGVPPEQLLLALPDSALAAFPDRYLRTLSPEIQEKIRRRIGRPRAAKTVSPRARRPGIAPTRDPEQRTSRAGARTAGEKRSARR